MRTGFELGFQPEQTMALSEREFCLALDAQLARHRHDRRAARYLAYQTAALTRATRLPGFAAFIEGEPEEAVRVVPADERTEKARRHAAAVAAQE